MSTLFESIVKTFTFFFLLPLHTQINMHFIRHCNILLYHTHYTFSIYGSTDKQENDFSSFISIVIITSNANNNCVCVCVAVVIVSICLVCFHGSAVYYCCSLYCYCFVFALLNAHTIVTQYSIRLFSFIPSEKQLIAPNVLYDMPFAG